jgi:hypothetical protein
MQEIKEILYQKLKNEDVVELIMKKCYTRFQTFCRMQNIYYYLVKKFTIKIEKNSEINITDFQGGLIDCLEICKIIGNVKLRSCDQFKKCNIGDFVCRRLHHYSETFIYSDEDAYVTFFGYYFYEPHNCRSYKIFAKFNLIGAMYIIPKSLEINSYWESISNKLTLILCDNPGVFKKLYYNPDTCEYEDKYEFISGLIDVETYCTCNLFYATYQNVNFSYRSKRLFMVNFCKTCVTNIVEYRNNLDNLQNE